MRNYDKVQLVAYGTVTSETVQVLPDGNPTHVDYDADMKVRGAMLCKVANWIQATHGPEVSDPTVLKVLVLPEFYFRFGGPVARDAPPETLNNSYPDAQAKITNLIGDVLVPQFEPNTWNDWIVVAGSVFWHATRKENPNGQVSYLNTSIVINGGELPDEPDTNGDPTTVPTMGRFTTNQKALMSQIDWSLERGADKAKWDAALNKMFHPVLTDFEYLRWHRFMARGKGNSGGEPIVFGVEVCLEHVNTRVSNQENVGVLRALQNLQPKLPASDVHVVTSCGMSLNPDAGVTTSGCGVAMICDGMRPDTHCQGYQWPTADVRKTAAVFGSGERLLSASANRVGTYELPEQLQIGEPFDSRTPKDAVSIWEPVHLP